ncbi:MAG TPA: alkaline phosphatase family protein [Candidatus Binatia bacterium]|nr:alkaline phosphatase family protein [Candidatus Binatia bacterium]
MRRSFQKLAASVAAAASIMAVAAALATSISCSSGADTERHPVFVIGVDGLEWRLVLDLMRQDRMPNLARLLERGRFGTVGTMHPSLSPVIWTTVATGVTPSEHGIRSFVKAGGKLFTNRDRRAKAVWNVAGDHGRRSVVIGWWMTFPVEPVDGIMVAQVNTSVGAGRSPDAIYKGGLVQDRKHQVHPPELAPRMLGVAAEVDRNLPEIADAIFAAPAEPHPDVEKLWKQSMWSVRADATYERIAIEALEVEPDADLFMVYFGGTDVLGHRFWRWAYPQDFRFPPSKQSLEAYGSVMSDYYRHTDGVIGRIVEAAPSDATIIVVSDHGMGAANRRSPFDPDAKGMKSRSGSHGRSEALFVVAGPSVRADDSAPAPADLRMRDIADLGSIFDVAPTVLALLDLPVGRDMRGKVMTELFDPAFFAKHPVRMVESHTPKGWHRRRELPPDETPAEQERLEQLRSLGYIQ